jgi:cell fate (sporulation/competence/biofilm development) regulator YlbF (YheA/YmcA/DUF963 family)
MNYEQKLKLAKVKRRLSEPKPVEVLFDDEEFKALHASMNQLQEQVVTLIEANREASEATQESLQALVDKDTTSATVKGLTAANNALVQLISSLESNGKIIERGIQSSDDELKELATSVTAAIKDITIPEPAQLPAWLATPKAVEQLQRETQGVATQIKAVVKALKQSQKAEDFIPYRRVVKRGNLIEFDDSVASPGGGGGGNGLGMLIPFAFDSISVPSYNANNDPLIVIYGNGGAIVATLTITYDGDGNISTVERT